MKAKGYEVCPVLCAARVFCVSSDGVSDRVRSQSPVPHHRSDHRSDSSGQLTVMLDLLHGPHSTAAGGPSFNLFL
ncbi:hypothetical protein ElyMa_004870100 [Elysia marginata]|uniref:Uncharacterized protein n=1 Tax=Elysia marginata TaxID=1093978 RepID=A0AAV4IWL7_9GAST|nr:hypothetical protein ElyMa_004870100 [Elysia marginata]